MLKVEKRRSAQQPIHFVTAVGDRGNRQRPDLICHAAGGQSPKPRSLADPGSTYIDTVRPTALVGFLLIVLAASAWAAPGRSVDVPVTPTSITRATGSQWQPRVVTDGRDFLAVWIDSRGGYSSLYGTRILADGSVLDPLGILISAPEQYCDSFALAWDGANYVVVWQADSRVSFTRVSRDGSVLGQPQTVFDRNGATPFIASNGRGSIVLTRFFSQYLVAFIPQDGPAVLKPSLPESAYSDPMIASDGNGYLVAWRFEKVAREPLQTALLRLDDAGEAVTGSHQELPEGFYTNLAAGSADQYLLSGRQFTAYASCARSILGRLVSSTGVSAPVTIHDAGAADIQDLWVTADGNGFLVAWMKRVGPMACPQVLVDPGPSSFPRFRLEESHVDNDGNVGKPYALTDDRGEGSDEQPAIASNGVARALIWIEVHSAPSSAKIAGAITRPGERIVPQGIASSAPAQTDPVVIAGNGLFMTAWTENGQSSGWSTVFARRFDTDGRLLDAAPIQISMDDHSAALSPAVSFDGSVWLFVWVQGGRVLARRMSFDGSWIDPSPIEIVPYSAPYAIASTGNGLGVLTLSSTIALTTVPPAGEIRKVTLPITLGFTESPTGPSMAWDGTSYVAVWSTYTNSSNIEGIRFTRDGELLSSRFDIAKTSRTEWSPSVACHQGECVVAWFSSNSIGARRLVNGSLVPASKSPDNILITPASGYAFRPRVLPTRDGYFLVWNELLNKTPLLLAAALGATGTSAPAATSLGSILFNSAAITARGELALAFARPDPDPASGGAVRAYLRVWPVGRRRTVQP